MKWITRANANVDRVACPWLIKRFIDPKAEFLFVPADGVMETAKREQAIPYDVPDVELGHIDGRCSFESIVLKYNLRDPALAELARIVHGADVAEDVGITPQSAGLSAIARGFALVHGLADQEKIRLESPMYDALYAWCQTQGRWRWSVEERRAPANLTRLRADPRRAFAARVRIRHGSRAGWPPSRAPRADRERHRARPQHR